MIKSAVLKFSSKYYVILKFWLSTGILVEFLDKSNNSKT